MKKLLKGSARLLIGAVFAMNCIISVSASVLSREELYEKYQSGFDAAVESGVLNDARVDIVSADAETTRCVYGDTCTLEIGNGSLAYSYSGELSQNYYYIVKPDGTACVTGSDYRFFAEENTHTLRIPNEIDGYTVTEIGAGAFKDLKWNIPTLERIVVPDTVEKIQPYAFNGAFLEPVTAEYAEGCKINIPSEVKYLGHGCYGSLNDALGDTVVLPETLEYIDYWAFGTQTYISDLVLPESPVVCLMGFVAYQTSKKQEATGTHSVAYFENCLSSVVENEDGSFIIRAPEEASTQPTVQLGDVDCTGEVDISDAILLARYLAMDTEVRITRQGLLNADVNHSGALDAEDITMLFRYIAHLITEF